MYGLLPEENKWFETKQENTSTRSSTMRFESRFERWVKQARLFVQDFDEGRRAEVVMMLVDEQQRDRLESHCFVERPMSDDERVEYLLGVIISMYKMKKDLRRITKTNSLKESKRWANR